jgi:hypothetical protein
MQDEQKFKPHEVEVPQDWFFSFGYGQAHPQKFIRIHGTYNHARGEMFRRHGAKWFFQYPGTPEQEQELKRHFITELKE